MVMKEYLPFIESRKLVIDTYEKHHYDKAVGVIEMLTQSELITFKDRTDLMVVLNHVYDADRQKANQRALRRQAKKKLKKTLDKQR